MTKLAYYRTLARLTLRELGERVGVTAQTVHDTEVRGIRSTRLATRYAAALGHDWRDLLDDPEDPAPRARVNHKKGEKR